MSLSSRRAWIEIYNLCCNLSCHNASLSSRRAWIEIVSTVFNSNACSVALLTESVDWNTYISIANVYVFRVALLTESVDWNRILTYCIFFVESRSPHGERGLKSWQQKYCKMVNWSLSSRRAWIEILCGLNLNCSPFRSLSSRRAWIEISAR